MNVSTEALLKSLAQLLAELAGPPRLYRPQEYALVKQPVPYIQQNADCLEYFSMAARWSEAAMRLGKYLSIPPHASPGGVEPQHFRLFDTRAGGESEDQGRLNWEMTYLVHGVSQWADRIVESRKADISSIKELRILPSPSNIQRLNEISVSLNDAKWVVQSVNGRWRSARWFKECFPMPHGLDPSSSLAASSPRVNEKNTIPIQSPQEIEIKEQIASRTLSTLTSVFKWTQKLDAGKVDDYPWKQSPNESTLWLIYVAAAFLAKNPEADPLAQAQHVRQLLESRFSEGIKPDDHPFANKETINKKAVYVFDTVNAAIKLDFADIKKRIRDHQNKVIYLSTKLS
ncbi:Uncharacterised protein [Xylophilus ampelinus]|nr:Uncharacterised protein [Xylophilus ampelinus]